MGQAELWSKGHVNLFIFYTAFQAYSYNIGDLIEDFIFGGDLGAINL